MNADAGDEGRRQHDEVRGALAHDGEAGAVLEFAPAQVELLVATDARAGDGVGEHEAIGFRRRHLQRHAVRAFAGLGRREQRPHGNAKLLLEKTRQVGQARAAAGEQDLLDGRLVPGRKARHGLAQVAQEGLDRRTQDGIDADLDVGRGGAARAGEEAHLRLAQLGLFPGPRPVRGLLKGSGQILAAVVQRAPEDRLVAHHEAKVGAAVPDVGDHPAGQRLALDDDRGDARPVEQRRDVERVGLHAVRRHRRQELAHVLDTRRHHQRAATLVAHRDLPARREHAMVQDHVVELVDDLAFHLVAHDLLDFARVGEGQVEDAQGEHLAGQREVDGAAARQAGDALAQSLALALGEWAFVNHDPFLVRRHDPGVAEPDFEDGELHRPSAEIDSGDGVGHGVAIPPASTG